MTRDEILKLDGQALVEAVAEKVMGWKIIIKDIPYSYRPPGLGSEGWSEAAKKNHKFYLKPRKDDYPPDEVDSDNWNPLTDENRLAEVREKMIERGYTYDAYGSHMYDGAYHDKVKWAGKFGEKEENWADGKSYPLTLLRAALLAVEER